MNKAWVAPASVPTLTGKMARNRKFTMKRLLLVVFLAGITFGIVRALDTEWRVTLAIVSAVLLVCELFDHFIKCLLVCQLLKELLVRFRVRVHWPPMRTYLQEQLWPGSDLKRLRTD